MYSRSTLLALLLLGIASAFGCGSAPEAPPLELKPKGHPCFDGNQVESCVGLGKRVLSQTRPDYGQARKLLSRACLVNHAEGCGLFGGLLQEGLGGPIDHQRASNALTIGCEGGQEDACLKLSALLRNPLNQRMNINRAESILRTLCTAETPSPIACRELGVLHESAEPLTDRNIQAALTHHSAACALGEKVSCVSSASLGIQHGNYPHVERTRAVDSLKQLCEEDSDLGCFELAELHQRGAITNSSATQAAVLYRAVCDQSPPRGCFEAGQLYERGLIQARAFEATALYTRGCEHGHDEACERRSALAAIQAATQP